MCFWWSHRTWMDVLKFFNVLAIQYSSFLSYMSYPMPTLCFVDAESWADNSTTDALQFDEGSCSDVLYNMANFLKHSSNTCCTSSFYFEIVLPQDNYFMSKYTIDIEQSSFMLANVILDQLEHEPGLYNILILFFIWLCGEVWLLHRMSIQW